MYNKIKHDIQQEYYVNNYSNDGQRFIAWYLRNIYGLDEIEAKQCVTDGSDDKKIDAVYIDNEDSAVHIMQGKFYQGMINAEPVQECLALFNNLKDLKRLEENGNQKIQKKVMEISQAIDDEYNIYIELITPSYLTESAMSDFLSYQQDIANQDGLPAEFVLVDNDNLKVRYDDALNNSRPYISYEFNLLDGKYMELNLDGTKAVIAAIPLVDCYKITGIRDGSLFRKNVRQSLGISNKINKGIATTLRTNPEDFFFFHNGITAICSSLQIQGDKLYAKNLNVVNGCQSLTTIANCSEAIKQAKIGYILFKFYEISDDLKCDKISTSTNSQSAVKARDLKSNHIAVLSIQKAYNQMYTDGYFLTKRGEIAPDNKTNKNHIVNLSDLGKWLVSWHSQRPTIAYSETKLFEKYFTQLFKKDYAPENIQALNEIYKAVISKWTKENPLDLNESLLAMKSYAPFHHLYAISYFFCAINKMPETVPIPKIALKRLKDNNLLEDVVNMAGQCLNMALTNANEDYISNNKVFSPQNWIKQKGCLKAIKECVQITINNFKMLPAGKDMLNRLNIGLKMDNTNFEDRWTAE